MASGDEAGEEEVLEKARRKLRESNLREVTEKGVREAVAEELGKPVEHLKGAIKKEVFNFMNEQRSASTTDEEPRDNSKGKKRKAKGEGEEQGEGAAAAGEQGAKKRARSAYQFFAEEMKPRLKEEGVPHSQLANAVSARWKNLDGESKEKYERLSKEEKERVRQEKRSAKKRAAPPSNKPKRPRGKRKAPTAYVLFMRDRRQEVVDNNPDFKFRDVQSKLGEMWKNLPEAERRAYDERAKEAKEQFREEEARGEVGPSSGHRLFRLSPELADVVGSEDGLLSRRELTSRLWRYFRENKLKDSNDGRYYIPDARLARVIGPDKFFGFSIQKLIKPHIYGEAGRASASKNSNNQGHSAGAPNDKGLDGEPEPGDEGEEEEEDDDDDDDGDEEEDEEEEEESGGEGARAPERSFAPEKDEGADR